MGVIKKVIFRGHILAKPKHKNLFLDMEENIHIHYRDLRIELGRAEFEEFAATFLRQAAELGAIIRERNYEDGKLPNANQEDVRIWTESRLRHDIAYHPRRLSLEECGDGYHFHYRNYKLLLDPEEFRQLAAVFAAVDPAGGYARTYAQVLELLEENDIDFVYAPGNAPDEVLSIAVARYHVPKVKEIFRYIGFAAGGADGSFEFISDSLRVLVQTAKTLGAGDFRRFRALSGTERLVDFLARCAPATDSNEINRIKTRVLGLYHTILQGSGVTVETDPQLWLYAADGAGVVFPYDSQGRGGRRDADALYSRWSAVLAQFGLGFVKPRKTRYPPDAQERIAARVEHCLRHELAAAGAVSRIHLMGSATRGELGTYQAPFVHGKLAKLGSDIDILIEIDADREADLPASWRLVNRQSSNFCAVYHLGEIPLDVAADPQAVTQEGAMSFAQHLIDAYVHFPSAGHVEEKDAFLRRFGALLVYDRSRDGAAYADSELEGIARSLADEYAFDSVPAIERMSVSTENRLFKVFMPERTLVLKAFQAAGNYNRSKIEAHAVYEVGLIGGLRERGVVTAAVVPRVLGGCFRVGGSPALLYEFLRGDIQKKPEYPIVDIASALARMHLAQIDRPLAEGVGFAFDDTCMIWLPAFDRYCAMAWDDDEVRAALDALAPIARWHHEGVNRGRLFEGGPSVHCHGDVTPKNVILAGGEACFFDFNNAFYGPRIADVVDGAFEFSLAEQYFHLADFARFDRFIDAYAGAAPLYAEESGLLGRWVELIGLIKFAKELRVLLQKPTNQSLRRKRALAIAHWVLSRKVTSS
jgi:Ser/Thr protein kinase RdoA (MazF antagonist)